MVVQTLAFFGLKLSCALIEFEFEFESRREFSLVWSTLLIVDEFLKERMRVSGQKRY